METNPAPSGLLWILCGERYAAINSLLSGVMSNGRELVRPGFLDFGGEVDSVVLAN